uniref:Uncharacterized protein n=1 Tax=Avena sativa TaxID=4498 RepID=A0ACD5YGT2_AVESA
MLTGSTSSQVFGAGHHVHYFLGGSGGGDDPSRCPWSMKSMHELDAAVPSVAQGRKRPAAAGDELWRFPFPCPICQRTFCTEKAVHGHMRCHSERGWRGMEPPRPTPAGELAADGRIYRYVCDRCRAPFESRQALGGHRASHSGKRGCSWLARQELAETAAAAEPRRPAVVFDFDLNEPAPEVHVAGEEEDA